MAEWEINFITGVDFDSVRVFLRLLSVMATDSMESRSMILGTSLPYFNEPGYGAPKICPQSKSTSSDLLLLSFYLSTDLNHLTESSDAQITISTYL